MSALKRVAPAKLNFFLHMIGKRRDGYHWLNSLVGFTGFGDVVEVEPAESLTLSITGTFAHSLQDNLDDNLVLRAGRALQKKAGVNMGAAIMLHKEIPMGAGLGGGSSDAAATLLALRDLWDVEISDNELAKLGMTLGSDVPVCLNATMAWVSGVGEAVESVPSLADGYILLVNPNAALLTKDVYQACKQHSGTAERPASIGSLMELVEVMQAHKNDLEKPAIALMPVIAKILQALRGTNCLIARMSGSGATCFAIYDDETTVREAAQAVREAQPGWWVELTTIGAMEYGKTQ